VKCIEAAVRYVVEEQGEVMDVYVEEGRG